jgi:hypothetical protein
MKAGDEVWVNHCGNFHSQHFVEDILAWITPLTWRRHVPIVIVARQGRWLLQNITPTSVPSWAGYRLIVMSPVLVLIITMGRLPWWNYLLSGEGIWHVLLRDMYLH